MQNDLAPVIVVSGFPRTGTSTMMRMLHFGGIEVMSVPEKMVSRNEFDPYGNFELPKNQLKQLKNEWTPEETAGKAVKIVTPYVAATCPLDRPVRVIFMIRDPNEIVASLLALQTVWEWDPIESIRSAHAFLDHHQIPVKDVQYKQMFHYPRSTALEIAEWVGIPTNGETIIRMAGAVDPKPREVVEGTGRQKRLVSYHFGHMIVNDKDRIELEERE